MGRSKTSPPLQTGQSWWASQTLTLQHTFCMLALIVVAVNFSWTTLFSGRSLVGGDTVEWKAVAQSMLDYREETGQEPLWATNTFAGMPGYIISSPSLVPQIDEIPRALRRLVLAIFACNCHASWWILACLVPNSKFIEFTSGRVCLQFDYVPTCDPCCRT